MEMMKLNSNKIDFKAINALIENIDFSDIVKLHSVLTKKISNYRTGNLEEDYVLVSTYGKEEPCLLSSEDFPFTRNIINILTRQLGEWDKYKTYSISDILIDVEEYLYYECINEDLEKGINIPYSEYVDEYTYSRNVDSWLERNLEDNDINNLSFKFYSLTCKHHIDYLNYDQILYGSDMVKICDDIKMLIMQESVKNNVSSFVFDW